MRRPTKFVFFCGGAMNPIPAPIWSLRQFLFKNKNLENRIPGKIVLAERATQLYRDTNYKDLITFEEDIARIAALVLLIAESAGSLAELGSFTSIDSIRHNLAVIVQTNHASQESFVRYGPVKRLQDEDEARVGVYPWTLNKKGHLIKKSASPHGQLMISLINNLVRKSPDELLYKAHESYRPFAHILWVLYLSQAIPISDLARFCESLFGITATDLRNKLYCMQLAGWVDEYPYGNKSYWFTTADIDPISRYAFKKGVAVNDTARRKSDVIAALKATLKIPKHVREHVAGIKSSVSS